MSTAGRDVLKLDTEYIIHAYTIDGKSTTQIAKELGCYEQPICLRLERAGIKRTGKRVRGNPLIYSIEYISNAYQEEKKSIPQIASELGCGWQTVWAYLKRAGVTMRSQSEAHKGQQTGPKNGFFGKHHSKESKLVMSGLKKGKKLTEDHRRKLSEAQTGKHGGEANPMFGAFGPKNPNWKGGISFEPYCPKFNRAFKESVRDKFNRRCIICGMHESENGRHLDIHHIDYDKTDLCNGKAWSFVPLCVHHHRRTNGNRHYWFNRLINYWAMNSEINLNSF